MLASPPLAAPPTGGAGFSPSVAGVATQARASLRTQAIAKSDSKALHPQWLVLLPAQAPSPSRAAYAPTLADVMLYDPHEQVPAPALNPAK